MALTDNHFELFQLPLRFSVDAALLAERYRELQRAVHPDKFANASDQERRLALQSAAQINEAFNTLKDPLKRAQYLLQLQGIEDNPSDAHAMDGAFLFEQMELRESLESIKGKADMDALLAFMSDIEQRQRTLHTELGAQFSRQDYPAMQDSVRKLQFFNKLHEEAMQLEEQM